MIYGENNVLWNNLNQLLQKGYANWCRIGGDFNTTLSTKEKWGGSKVRDWFQESMEDLINNLDLSNVNPQKDVAPSQIRGLGLAT